MDNEPTVMLLGAGASYASKYQLPTMTNFFNEDLDQDLKGYLGGFYSGANLQEYNLEEVLGYLELSRLRLSLWGYDPDKNHFVDRNSLYRKLLDYVKNRLAIPPNESCDLHQRLFESLEKRDTVLTVNYDLVADQVLFKLETNSENNTLFPDRRMDKLNSLLHQQPAWGGQFPSFTLQENEWGFYLKLHGSLDWLYCMTDGCWNNKNIYPLYVNGNPQGQIETAMCRECGAPLQTFIVPPVATKRLEDRGRLSVLWNIAFRELRFATRLVVIGVSFAPSDFELRWLIRQAVEARGREVLELHIVNPSKEHRENIRRCVPGQHHKVFCYETIDTYLAGVEV